MSKTLYERLGVDSSADEAEIRDSYLARIREAHPDFVVSPDHHLVRELNVAFTVLSNADGRRKYDQALTSDTCPWCGKPLPAYGLEQHVAQHGARDADQGCVVCGRLPTLQFRYQASTGLGLWRKKHLVHGHLCKTCSTGVFRAMQTRNLIRGPWSIISFFTTPYIMVKNWVAHRRTLGMGEPEPAAPLYDGFEGLGPKVANSPAAWLSAVTVVALVVGLAVVLASAGGSPEAPAVVVDQPTTTTLDLHDGWAAGVCARVDGAGRLFPTECGEHYAEVVAVVPTAEECPEPSELSLRLTEGVACFKYAFVREDS